MLIGSRIKIYISIHHPCHIKNSVADIENTKDLSKKITNSDHTALDMSSKNIIVQSGKTNHFESLYLSPRLQQMSKLKQTTMLE